jgi:hypothetical protein
MGMRVHRHAPPILPWERDQVPNVQQGGWAPGPVWTGAEKLAPSEIRSPDRPARSKSLYRLRYPGPKPLCSGDIKMAGGHNMAASQITNLFKCHFIC